TLAPDLDSMTATLAEGARVIVVAPPFGVPVDWDAIEQCLMGFGALAIEDAAQGHGALWRGAPVGSAGALSVLSFGRGKGWTGGRGGALLIRRFPLDAGVGGSRAAGPFDELAALGTGVAQCVLGRPAVYRLPAALPLLHLGETRFHSPTELRRMTRAAAALGAVRERLTRPHGRWPGAEELVRDLVTLPTHSLVSSAERDELVRLLE